MKEIEIKILDVNLVPLRKQLRMLGAKQVSGTKKIVDSFYKHESQKKAKGKYPLLRLRKNHVVELSTKKRKKDKTFLINQERQITLSDYTIAQEMLTQLGYKVFRHREKKREEWSFKGIKIELDQYPQIPPYMELETPNKKAALQLLQKLNVNMTKAHNWSATEVIRHYKKNPDHLVFK